MGDSITSADIVKWLKNVGDSVAVDDEICSFETSKVANALRATEAGILEEIFVEEGGAVPVGGPLYKLLIGGDAAPNAKPTETKKVETPAAPKKDETPAAPKKEVTEPKAAAPATPAPPPPKTQEQKPATPVAPASSRTVRPERMNRMRRAIAERLKGAQNTAAMLTTFNEIDMSNLVALRDQFKDPFQEKHGVKLGFMSTFIKASVSALQHQRIVNAVIDGENIMHRDFFDISVAVATPRGLVVPVLRDCDRLSMADLEKTLAALGARARKDEIALEEMEGGTFTISNGGVYGSMFGTPIINPPQSAILGMHAIKDRAVVINGAIVIRPMMYVALTYDHRLVDGREAVTFLRRIKDGVEDPRRLLLDL